MKLKTFPGGLHPPDNKKWSEHKPVEVCPLSPELVVPMAQHIGAPAEPCVAAGDKVSKGEVIGRAKGFVSVAVHAPTSGEVVAVEPRLHPFGISLPAVVIRPDGEDRWAFAPQQVDASSLTPEQLKEKIRDAGLVGMGGATFPTHVKLSPPAEKPIDTLIINGVECEPFLTADHRLMLEEGERVLDGIDILRRVLGVERAMLGIEVNKLDAIEHMGKLAAGRGVDVVSLQVKYPQGAEKQLILALTGREVPSGGLPMEVGVVVQNVATAAAVADAVLRDIPLIERIATITGPALSEAKNLRVRVGTPLRFLVEQCGGLVENPAKIILGGPMMGMTALSLDIPVTRGTSGLLLLRDQDVKPHPEGPCIRCGRCVRACPAHLLPTNIAAFSRLDMLEQAESYGALDCIECGCCSYSCPASIPLVQYIRSAKGGIMAKRRKV